MRHQRRKLSSKGPRMRVIMKALGSSFGSRKQNLSCLSGMERNGLGRTDLIYAPPAAVR
jgi:hypothetical protein